MTQWIFLPRGQHCLQIWSHVLVSLARLEHFHVIATSQNNMRSNQHKYRIIPLLISASSGMGSASLLCQNSSKILHYMTFGLGLFVRGPLCWHKVIFQALCCFQLCEVWGRPILVTKWQGTVHKARPIKKWFSLFGTEEFGQSPDLDTIQHRLRPRPYAPVAEQEQIPDLFYQGRNSHNSDLSLTLTKP